MSQNTLLAATPKPQALPAPPTPPSSPNLLTHFPSMLPSPGGMTPLDDLGRLLEDASHVVSAANEGHINGASDGLSAMPAVDGAAATRNVSSSGDCESFHVGHADRGARIGVNHVDPAGAIGLAPTASSAGVLFSGLVLRRIPPFLSRIFHLGTPIPATYSTRAPQTYGARDPDVSLDMIVAAAPELVCGLQHDRRG